ncbi:OmpA family protein [Sphingobacterium sp. LRF_L2]|uniref:OmpA family protein n=1 Tax=Sphingobacterium sp. LRF_L2 TaxID=3369421 RepID=UPI003F5FBB63
MKRILLAVILLAISFVGYAQVKESGDFQMGVFGGGSFPLGSYKSIGQTKTGYFGGFFADKYFKGNAFGLGIDVRYLRHGIKTEDSLIFENGHIATDYFNKKRFQHWAFTLGPTYKFERGRFQLETFLKGGIMLHSFPQYETALTYSDVIGNTTVPIRRTANDSTNKANAWVGLAGLRFNYKLSPNWAIFAQADYMQTFGSKLGGKSSVFHVEERKGTGNSIETTTGVKSFTDHYEEGFTPSSTHYKSVNIGVGVKYIFGKKAKKVVPTEVPIEEVPTVTKKVQAKDILVVVKDKQTGLALSGVTVSIRSADMDSKSISNANGEAERVHAATPLEYQIIGEKNGVKTNLLTIPAADFQSNETLIYREIFHDDPRFTLIGETVDCDLNKPISHIATVLTQSETKSNMNQTSDVEGKFIYQLDGATDYSIVANQAGQYSQTELVTTKGLDRSKTLYVTLKLGVCNLVEGDNWVLKNIHYDFDKSNIRPDAAIILDNVVAIMKQNPSLRIELSSHTDSRGKDDYNMRLSQQRAEAAVAYLVRNGIMKDRLVARGYGETRLVNTCSNGVNCSEAEHQENRRTEIKVLNYNK